LEIIALNFLFGEGALVHQSIICGFDHDLK